MQETIQKAIRDNRTEIVDRFMQEIHNEPFGNLTSTEEALFDSVNGALIDYFLDVILEHTDSPSVCLKEFATEQIERGWQLHYLTKALPVCRRVIVHVLVEQAQLNKGQVLEIVQEYIDGFANSLASEYTVMWQHMDSIQKMALKELSAPLVPIFESISVMPLVGTIDTERAKYIMENLLDGVIKHESQVALIDITGVPVVDTMVAQHLIKAAEAVRLVGAQCILVGIRPEIAQTIVNLGIDLGQFPTKSSLQKGVQLALSMTDRYIEEGEQK